MVRRLGQAVAKAGEESDDAVSTCDYAGGNGQVTIRIQRLAEKLNLASEIASLKDSFPGARLREVGGIGTRAFFLDIADVGTQLHVLRGDRGYLLVSVLGFGEARQVSAAAEKIARQALDRL